MELTYDPKYNVAYAKLHSKKGPVDTIKISDELNIDLGPDGTIYGIEFLNANEQLAKDDAGKLVVINKSVGSRQEISF